MGWSCSSAAMFTVVVTLLSTITVSHGWGSSNEKVLLKNVEAITLHAGSMTTGRRSSPIQQLTYRGSSSLAHFAPTTVQCLNRGHDGYDVQWECVAELPAEVKFGRINVACEGYDYPDDPYILRGSCGLEYTLEQTGAGQHNSYNHQPYSHHKTYYQRDDSSFSTLFVLVCVGGIIYIVYSRCLSPAAQSDTQRAQETSQPPPRRNRLYPDLDPPPYPGTQPSAPENEDPPPYGWAEDCRPGASNKSPPQPQQSTRQQTANPPPRPQTNTEQSGPGFWSGAGLGGVAGYLFGSRNSGGYYNQNRGWGSGWGNGGWGGGWGNRGWGGGWGGQRHYNSHGGGSWFGGNQRQSYSGGGSSWFGGGSSSRPASSGSTRRSTGFGGTSRR